MQLDDTFNKTDEFILVSCSSILPENSILDTEYKNYYLPIIDSQKIFCQSFSLYCLDSELLFERKPQFLLIYGWESGDHETSTKSRRHGNINMPYFDSQIITPCSKIFPNWFQCSTCRTPWGITNEE